MKKVIIIVLTVSALVGATIYADHATRVPRKTAMAVAPTSSIAGKPAPDLKLKDLDGKDVSLVWMNQPLPFHDHAMDAATAFQAAARQSPDKAWALHDKMYENNTALTRPDIEKYAGDVGLNAGLRSRWLVKLHDIDLLMSGYPRS